MIFQVLCWKHRHTFFTTSETILRECIEMAMNVDVPYELVCRMYQRYIAIQSDESQNVIGRLWQMFPLIIIIQQY